MSFDPHNCLLFVFIRWWKHSGYVVIRKSHYGFWPHFLWSKDLKEFEEYTPSKPNHHLIIPPPFYKGEVKITTADQQHTNK